MPRYRPSRSSEDEVGKVHKMIYQSGRFDENRSLIFKLSLGQIGEEVNE